MTKKIYSLLSFAAALLLSACADIDLCEEHEAAHSPSVRYSFSWGNYEKNAPETMYTMAYRLLNTKKQTDIVAANQASNDIQVLPGEYKFVTATTDKVTFNLNNLEAYMGYGSNDERANSATEKTVSYMLYSKEQLLNAPHDWEDENTYAQHIAYGASPFYYDAKPVQEIKNGTYSILFSPKPLTQQISVSIKLQKRENVEIEKVYADLSGVPVTFDFSTLHLDTIHTAKVLFPMYANQNSSTSAENANTTYTGYINVPSIVNAKDATTKTGPGIIQVIVYAKITDSKGNVTRQRMQRTQNIYYTIKDAGLTKYDAEDDDYLVRKGEYGTISYTSPIVVSPEMFHIW